MKVTAKGQITLNKHLQKALDIHPGDQVSISPKTGRIFKLPTKQQWNKVLSQIPAVTPEEIRSKNGKNN